MAKKFKNTNYVIVVDLNNRSNYLYDQFLLGWNNKYDWFDCDTCGDEITTPANRLKRTDYCCIDIDRWVSVYVGETVDEIKSYSDDGNDEGYNCTVCKLEKNSENEWIVIPV